MGEIVTLNMVDCTISYALELKESTACLFTLENEYSLTETILKKKVILFFATAPLKNLPVAAFLQNYIMLLLAHFMTL